MACFTCNKKQVAPDTMRSGRLPAEIRGSDRSSHGIRERSTLDQPIAIPNPLLNQAEYGTVGRSAFGAALGATQQLVREMDPVLNLAGMQMVRGDIGVTIIPRGLVANPIVYDTSYDGILPLTEQPKINKPLPFTNNG